MGPFEQNLLELNPDKLFGGPWKPSRKKCLLESEPLCPRTPVILHMTRILYVIGTHLPTLLLFTHLVVFDVRCEKEPNQFFQSSSLYLLKLVEVLLSSTSECQSPSDSLMFTSISQFDFTYNDFLPFRFCGSLYSLETIVTFVYFGKYVHHCFFPQTLHFSTLWRYLSCMYLNRLQLSK